MAKCWKSLTVAMAVVFCLALGLSWVYAQDESGKTDDPDYKKLARRQEETRKQLEHLESVMQELAKKIEAKQPDEAKKLRETWKAAREKLLLEDMEAIRKALEKGEGFMAHSKSKKVVKDLMELLNYLVGKQFERKNITKSKDLAGV